MANPNFIFAPFAFLGVVMCMIPVPWHLEAWNTGTCLYMLWSGLACLVFGVNAILFNHNAYNNWPIWCDISSRIVVAVNVGVPAAALCITRRLYKIASVQSATITRRERRRAVTVDLWIGLGIPLFQQLMYYINQGHRYDVFEDLGCIPHVWNTWVTVLTMWTWPVVIGVISGVYCCLSIRAFARRRAQFKQYLSANNNLSANRYFRLMALGSCDLLLTIPLATWALHTNVTLGLHPWNSWADTHSHFSRVLQYPRVVWAQDHTLVVAFEVSRWSGVACAFLFFAFFGFADEARKHYRLALNSVAKRMGYSSAFTSSADTSSTGAKGQMASFQAGLPSFVRPQPVQISTPPESKVLRKKDSFDSFDDQLSVRISIGSVYDGLEIKKDEDEDRPPTPPSTASNRSSMSSTHPVSVLPHLPEPALNLSSPPRHEADAPISMSLDARNDNIV